MKVSSFGAKILKDAGFIKSTVSVLIPTVPCSCMNILEFTTPSKPPLNIITLLPADALPKYKSLPVEYRYASPADPIKSGDVYPLLLIPMLTYLVVSVPSSAVATMSEEAKAPAL